MSSYPVKIHAYDVSHGKMSRVSVAFFGKYLDGLYHTAIVVHGNEYFYGAKGIAYVTPGSTSLGHPTEIIELGMTTVDKEKFHEYLEDLAETTYRPEDYRLPTYNCNNFSTDVSVFLTGHKPPEKISELNETLVKSTFGQMMWPLVKDMQGLQFNGVFIRRNPAKSENNQSTTTTPPNTV